jgi:hypothetical protein
MFLGCVQAALPLGENRNNTVVIAMKLQTEGSSFRILEETRYLSPPNARTCSETHPACVSQE